MVSFRRVVLALSILALFVGLAGAQVGTGGGSTGGPLACAAFVTVPPTLRSEGLTELIGDIVIQCTGGPAPTLGSVAPTANITVSLGTNVTSKLVGGGGTSTIAANTSEALLFIDEPTTSLTNGPGPASAMNACSNTFTGAGPNGCATAAGALIGSYSDSGGTGIGACAALSGTACVGTPINTFQGLVSGNQVTFNGVPIIAPVTGGFTRVYRITNVRANVAGLGGGGLPGTTQLLASVSISGSTALPVANPVQIAGFIQSGLSTSVSNSNPSSNVNTRAFAQCNNAGTSSTNGPASSALLTFKENFATAFKTRVAANATTNGGFIGASGLPNQSTPGVNYNSESGLVTTVNGATVGFADFGTRLKAVFNNIPAGVRVFVSTFNVISINNNANTATYTSASVTNGAVSPTVAVMVPSEIGTNFAGLTPPSVTFSNLPGTLLTELPVVNGTATSVWEVVQANFSNAETVQFGVLYTFTGNQSNNTPPAGTGQVNLSYAPTAGSSTFSATAGAAASGSLPIPRFVDTSSASTAITINLCQTDLLYPFVTNINGFDTGLAIANTSTDPFGTTAQAGSCTLNFYGSSAPSPVNTGNVATGTVYANTASTVSPGFQGYMIAVCNFQFAHGFAFVSDVGARNLAMGYLALVINNGSFNRGGSSTSAENLNN